MPSALNGRQLIGMRTPSLPTTRAQLFIDESDGRPRLLKLRLLRFDLLGQPVLLGIISLGFAEVCVQLHHRLIGRQLQEVGSKAGQHVFDVGFECPGIAVNPCDPASECLRFIEFLQQLIELAEDGDRLNGQCLTA